MIMIVNLTTIKILAKVVCCLAHRYITSLTNVGAEPNQAERGLGPTSLDDHQL